MNDERAELKDKFIAYYEKMPVKKYAAYSIGKDEDTTRKWELEDADFADRIRKARANYLLAKAGKLRPEFIIPVLFRELTPRTEITGADGEALAVTLTTKRDGQSG